MGNDRYAGVRRLPDAPIAGESYRNAGSHYKVWQYNAAADTAHVENDLRRDVEGTFNRYGFSLAVDELVLENILQAVRAQMQQDADEEPKKQDATAQANLAIARMTQARSKGDQTESAPTDDVTRKR